MRSSPGKRNRPGELLSIVLHLTPSPVKSLGGFHFTFEGAVPTHRKRGYPKWGSPINGVVTLWDTQRRHTTFGQSTIPPSHLGCVTRRLGTSLMSIDHEYPERNHQLFRQVPSREGTSQTGEPMMGYLRWNN